MNPQLLPELPRYRCHKEVRAARIEAVERTPSARPVLSLEGGVRVPVTSEWEAKHCPQAGGYYVVYNDGYTSFSPGAAFEEGYTRI